MYDVRKATRAVLVPGQPLVVLTYVKKFSMMTQNFTCHQWEGFRDPTWQPITDFVDNAWVDRLLSRL